MTFDEILEELREVDRAPWGWKLHPWTPKMEAAYRESEEWFAKIEPEATKAGQR